MYASSLIRFPAKAPPSQARFLQVAPYSARECLFHTRSLFRSSRTAIARLVNSSIIALVSCMANRSHTVPAPLYGYLHRAHNTLLRFSRLGVLFLTDVGEGQAYVSARQCTFAMPMSPQCRYGGGYISRPWVRISVSTRCSIPGSVKQGAQGWHTGCHDDNILLNPYRVSICQTRIVKSMTYKPQRTSGTGLNTTEVSVCPSR